MIITISRIYDTPRELQGFRVLVDRLWPRGVRKDEVHLDLWLKDIAPSDALRKWFGHDPAKWKSFKQQYFAELESKPAVLDHLIREAGSRSVVLLYGARDTEHNQAVALKEYLERRTTGSGTTGAAGRPRSDRHPRTGRGEWRA